MKIFCIQAKLSVLVSIRYSANSLEEVLEEARKFKDIHFITAVDEWQDTDRFEITGIYETE